MTAVPVRRAAAAVLAGSFDLDEQACKAQSGDAPALDAGQPDIFFAVHGGAYRSVGRIDHGLMVRCSFEVTVSVLFGGIPRDEADDANVNDPTAGLDALVLRTIAAIHRQLEVTEEANRLARNGLEFIEDCEFSRCTEPVERPGTWWGGRNADPSGHSIRLSFDGPLLLVSNLERFKAWPSAE